MVTLLGAKGPFLLQWGQRAGAPLLWPWKTCLSLQTQSPPFTVTASTLGKPQRLGPVQLLQAWLDGKVTFLSSAVYGSAPPGCVTTRGYLMPGSAAITCARAWALGSGSEEGQAFWVGVIPVLKLPALASVSFQQQHKRPSFQRWLRHASQWNYKALGTPCMVTLV